MHWKGSSRALTNYLAKFKASSSPVRLLEGDSEKDCALVHLRSEASSLTFSLTDELSCLFPFVLEYTFILLLKLTHIFDELPFAGAECE
jgi:hypothetical protein